jgi:hypothetical protein
MRPWQPPSCVITGSANNDETGIFATFTGGAQTAFTLRKIYYIFAICGFYTTLTVVVVLWAGCKHSVDNTIPNAVPYNSGSESDPTETKQEHMAEPSSKDLDNATADSQSIMSEVTNERDRSPFSSSWSHITEKLDEPPNSIANCSQEPENYSLFSSSGSHATEETDELLISMEQCIQELGDLSSSPISGSHATEETDALLVSIENYTQELQEAQQRFATGQYDAE